MTFIDLDKDNWQECAFLTAEKDIHIASNLYSIAEAQFYPKANSKAIQVNGKIVGYTLYGEDEDREDVFYLDRFMIASAHRRKGYGRQGIATLLELWEKSHYTLFETSTAPENLPMKALLTKMGFSTEEEISDGEVVYFRTR